MSTTSSGVDINTKYQKLAAEYAKLRNQFPVLKKAVVDEQFKNAVLTDFLKEELKGKEQILRKTNVEMESLTFRNQQLAKRVEHLQSSVQDEVPFGKNQNSFRSSKRIPHSVSEQTVSANGGNHGVVLEEELQRKLVENEMLHKQIHEMQSAHESESHKLLERIKAMESDSFTFRTELSNFRSQHETMVDELKSEKIRLQKSLETVQTKLSDSARDLQKYQKICDSFETNGESNGVDELSCLPADPSVNPPVLETVEIPKASSVLVLDDEKLNKLDVPPIKTIVVEKFVQFLLNLKPYLSDLTNHLTNFHSYCEQRSKLYPCDNSLEELSATSIQYGTLLKDKSNICRSISAAFELICDKHNRLAQNLKLHNDIKMVFDNFALYNNFLKDLLPLLKKSIDEECLVSWCNQRLERENRSFEQMFENVVLMLSQFYEEILDFLYIATADDGARFISALESSLNLVVKSFHDLASQYSLKIAEEHQLPVATKKLKTTNECINSSLSSIVSSFSDIIILVESQKQNILSYLNECLIHSMSFAYDSLMAQHLSYADKLSQIGFNLSTIPSISSSSSLQAIQSSVILLPNELTEDFQRQIKEKQKLIAELEKEKEHWAFEAELLRHKVDQQKNPNNMNNNEKDNLHFVKEYYGDKLLELNMRLQSEESKVVVFQRECHSLINSVQLVNRQKEKLHSELRHSAYEINMLKDELETVRQGYENQMKMLAEHLAQMNQKLTKQTDEIDMLKQALNEKTHKKGLFR